MDPSSNADGSSGAPQPGSSKKATRAVFTSAELASNFADFMKGYPSQSPSFTIPPGGLIATLRRDDSNQALSATPSVQRQRTVQGPPARFGARDQQYEIRDVPGKGKGMIASRNIQKGDLVLQERPIILLPMVYGDRIIILNAINNLHDDDLQNLLALCDESRLEDYSFISVELNSYLNHPPTQDQVRGVSKVICNRFGDADTCQQFVLVDASRINHSCNPNTVWTFDNSSKLFSVRAATDIPQGTEITVTYIYDLLRPRESRRAELDRLGFTCECEACGVDSAMTQYAQDTEKRRNACTNAMYSNVTRADLYIRLCEGNAKRLDQEPLLVYENYLNSRRLAKLYACQKGSKQKADAAYTKAEKLAYLCYGDGADIATLFKASGDTPNDEKFSV